MAISLKAARVNAGFRQVDAAKAMGISKGTLSNYENYITVPTIEVAQAFAKLYGMSVDDIKFLPDSVL